MKAYGYKTFLIISIGFSLNQCKNAIHDNHGLSLSTEDTVVLVQAVLSDKTLESEIIKDFGKQPFKLVEGPASKLDKQFIFAGNPVKVVPLTGDFYQIHQQHPKELYVSVPEIKFFSKDSATVLLIFHAGNATALFNLKNDKEKWTISGRQYGKF